MEPEGSQEPASRHHLEPDESSPHYILEPHLHIVNSSTSKRSLLRSGFQTKTVHEFLTFLVYATCPSNQILIPFNTNDILHREKTDKTLLYELFFQATS